MMYPHTVHCVSICSGPNQNLAHSKMVQLPLGPSQNIEMGRGPYPNVTLIIHVMCDFVTQPISFIDMIVICFDVNMNFSLDINKMTAIIMIIKLKHLVNS